MAGRGWGKTLVGAQDMAWYGRTHPKTELLVMGRTDASVRRVCVEGPTGLLSVLHESEVADYNRSSGYAVVKLDNGTKFYVAGAASPDAILGLNLSRAWVDELAAWTKPETWYQALLPALRAKGSKPQVVVTTTPRPVGVVKDLVRDPSTIITRGSIWENADNLDEHFLTEMRRLYEGTRLGRQELEGELLEDIPGALWTLDRIDKARIEPDDAPEFSRVVVAIDPAGGSQEHNDETGIVVAAKGVDDEFYVLADRSGHYSPEGWAQAALVALDEFMADRIVAEQNFGMEMVEHTIRTVRRDAPVVRVSARRGKTLRAEPISALYEQGRVHHIGSFGLLEDQMCTFIRDTQRCANNRSPDRLDALVWALTDLSEGHVPRGARMRVSRSLRR